MPQKKKPGDRGRPWTANDVRNIRHNPVYIGLGPYPPAIDEATWIKIQEPAIREDGIGSVLLQIRRLLRETFGYAPDWMTRSGWLEEASAQCAQEGTVAFFTLLLQALRDEYAPL